MRRRWKLIAVVAALVLLAGWGFWERQNRIAYVNALEANAQLEFYNVLTRVEEAEVALAKALVAASPRQQVFYLTEVWNEATDAQDSLSQLPIPNLNLSATRKFLAQLGDYCLSLARKTAGGGSLTVTDRNNLSRLQAQLGEFGRRLHALETRLTQRNFRWASMATPAGRALPAPPPRGSTASAAVGPEDLSDLGNLERQIQEMPSLTYDGPFSDHLLRVTPKGLTGARIDRATAEAKALTFARKADLTDLRVTAYRRTGGPMPAHSFVLSAPAGGSRLFIDVSEKGGHIVQMLFDRPLGAARLDASEATARAQAFLRRQGFTAMTPTYSLREANAQTITFAAREGEALVYPDLIKVKVALDKGQIVGWDATTYLTNHHARSLPRPRLGQATARARVNPDLVVGRGRLCVIPTAGGREVLAWEFSGARNGDRFLVYINALTGAEEQILKVVEQPGGQLVM